MFTPIQDIIENQIQKTGRSRGEDKIVVDRYLKKFKKQGVVVSITHGPANIQLWGLPAWLNTAGEPKESRLAQFYDPLKGRSILRVDPLLADEVPVDDKAKKV